GADLGDGGDGGDAQVNFLRGHDRVAGPGALPGDGLAGRRLRRRAVAPARLAVRPPVALGRGGVQRRRAARGPALARAGPGRGRPAPTVPPLGPARAGVAVPFRLPLPPRPPPAPPRRRGGGVGRRVPLVHRGGAGRSPASTRPISSTPPSPAPPAITTS